MSVLVVLLVVVGGLALAAAIVIAVMIQVGRKLRRIEADVRAGLAPGERFLLEPAVGNYRGASGRFGIVKGVALLAVTDRRVICRKAIGAPIELPLAEVAAVREERWFLRSSNGMLHLVLTLRDGVEVGLQTRDHGRWLAGLRAAIAAPAATG